jgi:hypothetical protein
MGCGIFHLFGDPMKATVSSGKRRESFNGAITENQGLSKVEFTKRLAALVKRWRSHHEHDLVLRHETGVLLNDRFGDPTQRQRRGSKIIKQASEKLGIDVADMCRLRWFAYRFKSVDDLKQQHPDIKSWTQVRDLLCRLSQCDGPAESKPAKDDKPARKVIRALATLKTALQGFDSTPAPEDREVLLKGFQELAEEVSRRLGVPLTVEASVSVESGNNPGLRAVVA